MKKLNKGSVLISSILFISCLVLLWIYVEVLPIWITDPYTYSAYKMSKQVSSDLNRTLNTYSKIYGMANKFSDFTTVSDSENSSNADIYSFEPLLSKGVHVGSIDRNTLRFNKNDLDSEIIEINWVCQNVTATYKLQGNTITTHVRAIFSMGEVIEEDLNIDENFLF